MTTINDYKLLIVDDEPFIREFLSTILMAPGRQIKEASNGQEALEIIEKEDIDLVILDNMMPIMSGIALLKIINQRFSDIFVIMLTAYGDKQLLKEAISNHVFDFIEKPILQEIVTARIQHALEHVYNKRLTNMALEEFIFLNFNNIDSQGFSKMPTAKKNQLLEQAVALLKLKNTLRSF